MKLKKSLCILLACLMLASLALGACGNSETGTPAEGGGSGSSTGGSSGSASAAASSGAPEADGEEEDWDEIAELKVVLCSIGEKSGWADIEEKINEISERKAGVRISVEWIEIGSWVQQMNLKMSSGDSVDLIHITPLMTFSNMYSQNELMDITDMLQEEGTDLLTLIPDTYWSSMMVNGRNYGVPMLFPKQGSVFVTAPTAYLEEYGVREQFENMDSWSDYEAILQAVKDKGDLVPMYINAKANTATTFTDMIDVSADDWGLAHGIDNLGDSFNLIYVDTETDTIKSYFHSDIFQADMARAADLYNKGLIYKDGANTDLEGLDALANGVAFSVLNGTENLTGQASTDGRVGQPTTNVLLAPQVVTTWNMNMWSYAVPYTAREPEAAVRFLNLLYTDSEIANLFTWGIEGRDFARNDDGTCSVLWGQNQYFSQYWLHGNSMIIDASEGMGDDYYDQLDDIIHNQVCSKYLGFICDTSSITNELTACNNAKQEYAYGLLAGSVPDYESHYAAFLKQLDDSGMQKILDCYQEQLDAWLAAN